MFSYLGAHPEVIAAFLSAIATIFAAIATIRGPQTAARLAEQLRRDAEGQAERHRFRSLIFSVLMQERANITSPEAVRMLNSIDVAFHDSAPVRDAWAELYAATDPRSSVPQHTLQERLKKLLQVMASDLDLSTSLRSADFERVYYPTSIAEERRLQDLQRKLQLQRLTGRVAPAVNTSADSGPFPSPPE